MRRHELSDKEWSIIEPLLPRKSRGVKRVDDRRGDQRDPLAVPHRLLLARCAGAAYGPRTTLYNRFCRWRASGVWDRLLDAVSAAYDGDIVMIDSSCVRVHQHGAGAKKGDLRIRAWDSPAGGLTTKIHALVDAEGRPIRIELTAGQAGDAPMATKLLETVATGATVRPTRPTIPTASGPSWPRVAAGRTSRHGSPAKAHSPSAAGSIASETSSSASSTASSRCAASPPATTGAPTTTSLLSNSPLSESGSNRYEPAA